MEINERKPSVLMMSRLHRVPISTIQPYALMIAPVFVFLKSNEKFVQVKHALDFFVPEELEKLKFYECFYFNELITAVLPFCEAGRKVRALVRKQEEPQSPDVFLPSDFEVAEQVFKILGPLWFQASKSEVEIEPYFTVVFVNEFCDLFPVEKLLKIRDQNTESFRQGLFRASWIVFLAIHLGYLDLEFLNALRDRVLLEEETGEAQVGEDDLSNSSSEVDELLSLGTIALKGDYQKLIQGGFFKNRLGRVAQKLENRLEKIQREIIHDQVR